MFTALLAVLIRALINKYMLIDLILDRKDGQAYDVNVFADRAGKYAHDLADYRVINALGMGTEEDVKKALCDYVVGYGYRDKICDFVNSVNWIE